jgi:hypothetical protein
MAKAAMTIPANAASSPSHASAPQAASKAPVRAPAPGTPGAKMATNEAEIPPAEDIDPSKIGNIADVPMAQGMLNKLEKELK